MHTFPKQCETKNIYTSIRFKGYVILGYIIYTLHMLLLQTVCNFREYHIYPSHATIATFINGMSF